jgi:hypothetical protein
MLNHFFTVIGALSGPATVAAMRCISAKSVGAILSILNQATG